MQFPREEQQLDIRATPFFSDGITGQIKSNVVNLTSSTANSGKLFLIMSK